MVLLKGAAYLLSDLRCAHGRWSSDVDILVERERLETTERALLKHNWISLVDDAYDQQYYRRWAHELPPLRHMLRGTLVDVHHTIVPLSSRLRPDPRLLLAASEPLPDSRCRRLMPADMVLHSAVHAFYDGDFSQVLRDLLDLHELIEEFSQQIGFWDKLLSRAERLGLRRPLFYGLRYCHQYLHTTIAPDAFMRLGAPPAPVLRLMDALAARAVFAARPTTAANWLLYMRAHWLRMPPLLLTRHLLQKSFRRLGSLTKMDEHKA